MVAVKTTSMADGPGAREFYERIFALRTVAGLSSRELSTLVAGNPSYLASGKSQGSIPTADRAIAIARVLGTTAEYLVAGEGEPPTADRIRGAVAAARSKGAASAA